MKVVVPMAGRGSRFANKSCPKPLIDILGKPMLAWTLESVHYSFPDSKPQDFIFIALREHETQFHITNQIEKLLGKGFTIHFIDEVTDGPVCTVMTIEHLLDPGEDFFTVDCDQYFRCSTLQESIRQARDEGLAGLIPTYESRSPAYSYAEVGNDGFVTRTAEKEVISHNAATGIYYFGSTKIFMDAARQMVENNVRTKNEFYMCPLYNIIISKGGKVRIVNTEEWMTLGTPEESKLFIEVMKTKA